MSDDTKRMLDQIRARREPDITTLSPERQIERLERELKYLKEDKERVTKQRNRLIQHAAKWILFEAAAGSFDQVKELFDQLLVMTKLMTEDFDYLLGTLSDPENIWNLMQLLDRFDQMDAEEKKNAL